MANPGLQELIAKTQATLERIAAEYAPARWPPAWPPKTWC
jgi:hypothetical protein